MDNIKDFFLHPVTTDKEETKKISFLGNHRQGRGIQFLTQKILILTNMRQYKTVLLTKKDTKKSTKGKISDI